MIVCHSRGFVFVHIHKTAGESITATFRPVLEAGDRVVKGSPPPGAGGPVLGKHSSAREGRDALGADCWARYFTFSFVRHPIDRTLSLYRYVERWATPPRPTLAQRLRIRSAGSRLERERWPEMMAYRATSSFSEFIRHPLLDRAVSMRPQVSSLCDENGELLVDFVGRFERLAADVAHVQRTLAVPETPLRSLNTTTGERHRRGLSPDDVDFLTSRFQEDLVRFGYPP